MQKMMNKTADVITVIVGVLFISLFFANILNITARYLFGISYIWIPDLSRILFIWTVFLGGTAAYIKKQHLIIDFVKNRFRGTMLRTSDDLLNLIMAGFFALLVVKGIRITVNRMNIPYDSWEAVPTGVAYIAVPIAGIIMFLATLVRILETIKQSLSKRTTKIDNR